MEKLNNNIENDELFKNLFEYNEEEDEKLYKNNLFVLKEEIEKQNVTNYTQFIHDTILNRISLEDYSTFSPKTENDNTEQNKEDTEKLSEEEINHLKTVHRLNYLTFSPFGTSFFPNLNAISNDNENDKNEINLNNNVIPEEEVEKNYKNNNVGKENKILDVLDFDYNNYEITNDLLFNISMGFIDIDKLKHENAVTKENFVPRSERMNSMKEINKKNIKERKDSTENYEMEEIKEKKEKRESSHDVELKKDLMKKLINFVKENEDKEFYSNSINTFYKDLNSLSNNSKNSEKNKLLMKWDKIFTTKINQYDLYLLEQKEKEKKMEEELFDNDEMKLMKARKNRKSQTEIQNFEKKLEKIKAQGMINQNNIFVNKSQSKKKARDSVVNNRSISTLAKRKNNNISGIYSSSVNKNSNKDAVKSKNEKQILQQTKSTSKVKRYLSNTKDKEKKERMEWITNGKKHDYYFQHL